MIPETPTALLIREEQHFLDNFHPKVISLTPQLLSGLWFLVGIALKKVKEQTNKAQLCKALLNEAKMERNPGLMRCRCSDSSGYVPPFAKEEVSEHSGP